MEGEATVYHVASLSNIFYLSSATEYLKALMEKSTSGKWG